MSAQSEINTALCALSELTAVYHVKIEDESDLTGTVAVFQLISDVPDIPIDGSIIGRQQRWQVSIWALDLTTGLVAKEAVIAALHGLRSGAVKWCEFDSAPGVIYESEVSPPRYHIPIDFMVSI